MSYTPSMYYDSGQLATVVLDEDYRDGYGTRIDPLTPIVDGVLDPSLVALDGFPMDMDRLGTQIGIFQCQFYLPEGVGSMGTYIAVLKWVDPNTLQQKSRTLTIVVGIPFGNASVVGV